jgi:ABC-type multidrug transport system fused ATPase/permease subunit
MLHYSGDAVKRDVHLLTTSSWILSEFSTAMDDLISRPRSFFSKKQNQFKTDTITTIYDIFSKFSLPFAVVYYGLDISLTNHAILAERLAALNRALANVARQFFVHDAYDQNSSIYFKCIQLAKEQAEKQTKISDAKIEDLTRDGMDSWEIDIRDVSFAYTQSPREPEEVKLNEKESPPDFVLDNFNFKFERGKTYGIVGHNGRGKTTLVQLLAGLYTPTKGQILINGIDMQKFDISHLRAKMSFLFQDFAKYYDLSVLENILIGDISSNDSALAAERAGDTGVDFVGLDAVLYNLAKQPKNPDEKWQTNLSGGQWQKIALARAFMRVDAELLVLDEPTSALDIESEHHLFRMILARRKGKTTIFVTHKLNTTRIADCILFIKDGKVFESGSHDELVALDGEYARLLRIQSTGYDNLADDE